MAYSKQVRKHAQAEELLCEAQELLRQAMLQVRDACELLSEPDPPLGTHALRPVPVAIPATITPIRRRRVA